MEENKEENKEENTVKVNMKTLAPQDEVYKVDLSKAPEPVEETTPEAAAEKVEGTVTEITEPEIKEEVPVEETTDAPIVEEITNEEVEEVVEEAIAEAEATGKAVPENIQKLMDFMEDTGGDLQDYVKLNQDFSGLSDEALLKEHYKQTKPHLQTDEIDFLIEDQFSFDEDLDEENDIKRKKLALKEQVASAKSHLDGQKSKYYEEVKAGSKLTTDQQKAIDFFGRYNKESEETQKVAEAQKSTFLNKTDNVFNDKFKGFEYNIGEKKFRFNVKDADKVKTTQSDINNFVKKFLNDKNEMSDAKGYHKSLFTAMNSDAIANHFYEQGKADAMKNSVTNAKNINMNPRQQHSGEVNTGGLKFKVLGESTKDFKVKLKRK